MCVKPALAPVADRAAWGVTHDAAPVGTNWEHHRPLIRSVQLEWFAGMTCRTSRRMGPSRGQSPIRCKSHSRGHALRPTGSQLVREWFPRRSRPFNSSVGQPAAGPAGFLPRTVV